MGGRVYDPTIGRFLSADLYIQAPHNTQSFNRYSHVFNNPLSHTDPSGYRAVLSNSHRAGMDSVRRGGCSEQADVCGVRQTPLTQQAVEIGRGYQQQWLVANSQQHWFYQGKMAFNMDTAEGQFLSGLAASVQDSLNTARDAVNSGGGGEKQGSSASNGRGLDLVAHEGDTGIASNNPEYEWTFQTNIGGYGDSARVLGGRYIKVEVGTVALGVGGAHVYVIASPLDVDGNILPTMRKNTADWNVGGHRVTSMRGGRPTVLDAGYDNQHGFQWNIWIPRQESAHGSSASVFVNIYTKRDE